MSSVATVMPEMGLDDDPISPVNRDETVTKRNPNSTISTAPRMFMCSIGASQMASTMPRLPNRTNFTDRSRSVRGTAATAAAPALSRLELRSRNPDLTDAMMSGMARNMAMMPPVATAPAPMY